MNGRLCWRYSWRFISRLLYLPFHFERILRPIVHRRHRPHYMLTSVGCPYCASCRFSIICTRFIIPRTPCKLWGFVEDCGRLYNPLQDLCALVFSRCLVGNSSLLRSVCGQGNRRAPPIRRDTAFPSTLRRRVGSYFLPFLFFARWSA